MLRKSTVALLLLLTLTVVAAPAAMVEVPLKTTTLQATEIVKGEVIGQSSDWDPYYRTILTDVTVRVDESLKGDFQKGETITVRIEGGEVGDMGIWVEHQPRFRDAEQVLLFLGTDGSGVWSVQSLEQGKYTLFDQQAYDYRGRRESLPELKSSIRNLMEMDER